jgi:riboflavin kinase/FMN adenylyltransferase
MKPLYSFSGTVITGQKRGAELGFPTANIKLPRAISEGIYAAKVTLDGQIYHSATFIGSAKTFKEEDVKAESYILDFSENIYNKEITVQLFKKIRDNQAFISVDDLIAQMHKDVQEIRRFFADTTK